ncbi:hypothetical protein ACFWY6_40455 [Streptomyces sp. NPDC059037]|uniref:hypothetical protein n=1 Tax=Streptomyces sp. NPDC059037 TaxID=3346710 RepID=UPI0036C3FC05
MAAHHGHARPLLPPATDKNPGRRPMPPGERRCRRSPSPNLVGSVEQDSGPEALPAIDTWLIAALGSDD